MAALALAAARRAGITDAEIQQFAGMSAAARQREIARVGTARGWSDATTSAATAAAEAYVGGIGAGGAAGGIPTTASKTALVFKALAGLILTLGLAVAAGSLVRGVGPMGGLALGGFTSLLIMPVMLGSMLGGGLGCGIGCSVLGGIAGAVKRQPAEGCMTGGVVGGVAGLVAGVLASMVLTYIVATVICNKISTLPSFTYTDSLKVFGHTLWMGTAAALIGCCMAPKEQRAAARAFFETAVQAGANLAGAGRGEEV